LEVTGDAVTPVRVRAAMKQSLTDFARPLAPGIGVEMLTSGTTGKPKRIPMRADAFALAVLAALAFEKGRTDNDAPQLRSGVQFLTGPMAHIGGLMAMFNAIIAGRKAFLMERFDVTAFVDAISRHRPKVVGTPPAALRMLLDAKPAREDLSSLRAYRTGTAPLDPDLADAFYTAYGVPVLQNYGATEFGGVAGWTIDDFNTHWQEKRGAVGRINPGVEARIVDAESGAPLPHGTQGVLHLKGRQIGDGRSWLATTDLAILDADGFLFIVGRADNAIVRGGFKVHPDDIVKALQEHAAIREAAVAALPDARLGHVPVAAYIVKSDASDPGAEVLTAFLRERLAPYQVPVRLLRVDDLPRTISMKVSQPNLRALFDATD
jgi:acyl-coenzyme A synthetase/AMP-(fatty) acid ligase